MCGGAPKPPDPTKTAAAQYQYNKQAAEDYMRMGAVDQFGPFGSTTYTRDDKGLPTSQNVNLSPEVQQWLDSQFGTSTAVTDAAQRQLGYLPQDRFQLPGQEAGKFDALFDPSNFDTSGIAQTSYDQAKSMFEPDLADARNANEIMLKRRGINPGDEIYSTEMDRLDRQANQAYSGAARQAQLDAGNEQSRRVNAAISGGTFDQNAYQTGLSNQLLERNQPFAEASALLGTNPSFQTPSFMNTPTQAIQSPDYQGQVNANYQQKANQSNSLWNTIGSIGSAAVPFIFSDEDLKEGREPVDGEGVLAAFRDMPVDSWEYTDGAQDAHGLPGGRMVGPMAQDYAEEFGGDGRTIPVVDALGRLAAAVKALEQRTREA